MHFDCKNLLSPSADNGSWVAHDPVKILARQLNKHLALQNHNRAEPAQAEASPVLTRLVDGKRWADLDAAIQCRTRFNKLKELLPEDELNVAESIFENNPQAAAKLERSFSAMLDGTPATTARKTSENELRDFAQQQHNKAYTEYEAKLEVIRASTTDDAAYTTRALLVEPPPAEKTFRRRLRAQIDRNREHFARTLKTVGKKTKCVSAIGLATKIDQVKHNDRHLEKCKVEMGDGETVSLLTLRDNAIKAKLAEMYAMQKGLEKLAIKSGHILGFATLTLPGEYHSNPKSNHRVSTWNGATVREAHDVLQEAWELLRAKCHQDGVVLSGGRCEEPHQDGTPHRHHFFYINPAHMPVVEKHLLSIQDTLGNIDLRWIQTTNTDKSDVHIEMRKGKITKRVEVQPTKRASPASYVMKYVYKALAAEMSSEKAWLRIQGIRAIQWFGVPPLGLWRTLRTTPIHHSEDTSLHLLARAARDGDYCSFVEQMGGLGIKQNTRPFQLKTLSKEDVGEGKKGLIIRKHALIAFSYIRDLRRVRGIRKAKTEALITVITNYSSTSKAKAELRKAGVIFRRDRDGGEYAIYPEGWDNHLLDVQPAVLQNTRGNDG